MQSYRTAASRLRHPVNVALHTNAPLGVRIANPVTRLARIEALLTELSAAKR